MIFRHYNELVPIVPYVRLAHPAPRKPWIVGERRLLDYLLVYVQEGNCRFSVNRQEYVLSPEDFCLIQPDQPVILEGMTDTVTPFMHFDVFYNPNRKDSFTTRPGQIDLSSFRHLLQPRLNDMEDIDIPVVFRPQQAALFRHHLMTIIRMANAADPLRQLKVQQLATELIIHLIAGYGTGKTAERHILDLNAVYSYIAHHLSDSITVKDMASFANLSIPHFNKLFREQTKTTPYRYLIYTRMTYAKELLADRGVKVKEVARLCGFTDEQHFCKMFKKFVGVSPRNYDGNETER